MVKRYTNTIIIKLWMNVEIETQDNLMYVKHGFELKKCPGMKPSKRASIQLWFQWRICCHNVLKLAVQYFGFCFRNVLKCELLKHNVVLRNICIYRSLFIHCSFVKTWNILQHFSYQFSKSWILEKLLESFLPLFISLQPLIKQAASN